MASFIVTFTQIIALVRKELLALIKEPASRALLIAPAFLQALLYGYGATYDLTHVPYAVLDQSRSAASTELLARIDGTGVFVRAVPRECLGHRCPARHCRRPRWRRRGWRPNPPSRSCARPE